MDVVIEYLKELRMVILIMAYAWSGTISLMKLIKPFRVASLKRAGLQKNYKKKEA